MRIKKNKEKWIEFYKKNINSPEFEKYLNSARRENYMNHRKFVEKEHPEWIQRADYYDKRIITGTNLYDILSNDGVHRLLKKLHSLPEKEYKVLNYYKKPTFTKEYDYIRLQYSQTGYGRFSDIYFFKDKYIDKINISWVQINNYFALFEYKFKFKTFFDDVRYNNFILDNIDLINSKDYFVWYHIDEKDINANHMSLKQMKNEAFSLICQHYITSLFFSEHGKANKLINLVFMTRKNPININTLYLGDLSYSYHNKEGNFVISTDFEKNEYLLFAGENKIPFFSICPYIAKYGNDIYYYFFGHRELKIFEEEFSEYITGRKKIFYNIKIKNLIMKIQSTSKQENRKNKKFYEEFDENWDFYTSNNKINLKEDYHKKNTNLSEIYKENFSYLQLLSEINYTKNNHLNSLVVSIASVIATIISIIALCTK